MEEISEAELEREQRFLQGADNEQVAHGCVPHEWINEYSKLS